MRHVLKLLFGLGQFGLGAGPAELYARLFGPGKNSVSGLFDSNRLLNRHFLVPSMLRSIAALLSGGAFC
jgi:hypothetical protein